MKFKLAALFAMASLLVAPVHAAPKVVADILPVHSLVSRIMKGVGEPELIISVGSTPHDFAMRPSEARMVSNADIIFWVGESLTQWMEKAIESLGNEAVSVELMHTHGIELLEADVDDHDHHKNGEHGHGILDPHIWLDPENAKAILEITASELARIDTENSNVYASNLASSLSEIDALTRRIEDIIAPVRSRHYVTAHDAYSYFENRFDLESVGTVSAMDGDTPGPAQIMKIRKLIMEEQIGCVFIEPQLNQKIVITVAEGTGARIGVLDPLGEDLEIGPSLYEKPSGKVGYGFGELPFRRKRT